MATLAQRLIRFCWRHYRQYHDLSAAELAPAQVALMKWIELQPAFHRFPLRIVRAVYYLLDKLCSVDKVSMSQIVNHTLSAPSGMPSINIRAYYPQRQCNSGPSPALVYYHGGGCVIGSIETHDLFCRFIAAYSGMIVLSVGYLRAPEHKFPVAVENAISAWNWVCEHHVQLGIDLMSTGVGGDNAGGYLATSVVNQKLIPSIEPTPTHMPAFQWLIYPMLDLRGATSSYQHATHGMLLTRSLMDFFRDHYLNSPEQRDLSLASAGLAESLQGSPATYLLTAGHDPLRDEGVDYGEKLQRQGVSLTYQHEANMMHGFISLGGICPHALRAMHDAVEKLSSLAQQTAQRKLSNAL